MPLESACLWQPSNKQMLEFLIPLEKPGLHVCTNFTSDQRQITSLDFHMRPRKCDQGQRKRFKFRVWEVGKHLSQTRAGQRRTVSSLSVCSGQILVPLDCAFRPTWYSVSMVAYYSLQSYGSRAFNGHAEGRLDILSKCHGQSTFQGDPFSVSGRRGQVCSR